MTTPDEILAFHDHALLARGAPEDVAVRVRTSDAHARSETILLFSATSGQQIDLDLSGTVEAVRARHAADATADREARETSSAAQAAPRRGRPKLGVVGREVTLLPRHWAWLEQQRGGASAALRRLVDEARRGGDHADRVRAAQDRTQRFLSALAGDLPGFEEAARALYAGDGARFEAEANAWPPDVRRVAIEFATPAFEPPAPEAATG